MLYKNTWVKITKSLGRYLSLALIVLIGVGFYAGVDVSGPDILAVADSYFDAHRMMDFKIVSTLGLTDEDVAALAQIDGVRAALPSYGLDMLSQGAVVRVHALETEVNKPALLAGTLPQAPDTCLADAARYALGDRITLDDADGSLKNTVFTVVGLIDSVLYLGDDYGGTSLGNGKLAAFIFVPRENFALEAYTEIYLTTDAGALPAYSEDYKAAAKALAERLSALRPEREQARLAEIRALAAEEIAESAATLAEERARIEAELAEARAELETGREELEAGRETGRRALARARAELDAGVRAFEAAQAQIDQGQAELDAQAAQRRAELEQAGRQIEAARAELDAALAAQGLTAGQTAFARAAMAQAVADMQARQAALPAGHPESRALAEAIAEQTEGLEALARLEAGLAELDAQADALRTGAAALEAELARAQESLDSGRAELEARRPELAEGEAAYAESLEAFEAEMARHDAELAEGEAAYAEGLAAFETEMADAEGKIADAWAGLDALEPPRWYIFGRGAAAGYDGLDSSIQVIVIVAAVLPFFFILLAALMTSNAMARMVAEERGELGTLASLGYGDGRLILTYILYVLSATWLGAGVGFWAGCRFIPPLIYQNFTARLPPLALIYHGPSLAVMGAAASALMVSVTVFACARELGQKPANLLRPLPPGRGRRIVLERVGPVWNRLSFTGKVTVRNLLRYKKRALMTMIGVSGCTALLLTGFGLRDGMGGVAQKQYGEQGILRYDALVILKDPVSAVAGELAALLEAEGLTQPLLTGHSAHTFENDGQSLDCYVVTPGDSAAFDRYFALAGTGDGQPLHLEPDGVIVTQRVARVFGIQAGDTLALHDQDGARYRMRVCGVAENYVANYIYMGRAEHARIFGRAAAMDAVVAGLDAELDADGRSAMAEHLMDSGLVAGVVFSADAMQAVEEATLRLGGVIVLIIVVASLLAAVVLYNLTAINISERTREIATLKVLGFRDGEANAYIYREAAVLTVLSMGVGLFLGVGLHHFLAEVIEDGVLALTREISAASYVLAVALTLVFSGVMQAVTYFKITQIDMIESLKSVE